MTRGFSTQPASSLTSAAGHQAPPWETWASELGVDLIPVLRLTENINRYEERHNRLCPPGLVMAYARTQGLNPPQEMIQQLMEERKAWRGHRAIPEPGPAPDHFHVDISAVPPVGGSVTPPSGDFPPGDLLLTANPKADYRFDRWTGDCSGTDNPITIELDDDKNITARFKRVLE